MPNFMFRLIALASVCALAACAVPNDGRNASVDPRYDQVQDGSFVIEPVAARYLAGGQVRTEVAYAGPEAPGTIVVDPFARKLYLVQTGGRAIRYAVAVGREGLSFRGNGVIGRKAEWPAWSPTANMIRTRPDLYAEYAAGLPGGLDNPLGARALYIYRNGVDSKFRIHGTIDNATVGQATSAGCIRLFNQDAIDLYGRIGIGARVHVRSLSESQALEGTFIDNAYGRAVPDTPANRAQREKDAALIAASQAKRAAAVAEAERRRLAQCRREGVAPGQCAPVPEGAVSG